MLSGFGGAITPPFSVAATLGTGITPKGLCITGDPTIYVANSNDYNIPGQNTVTAYDTTTNIVTIISDPSFNEPSSATPNAAGTLVYVTNFGSTTISIINTATNTVTGTITGFNAPSDMVIAPNGTTAYVTNYGNATVSVVDLTNNIIIGAPIAVGVQPRALAITPDGAYVYVANYDNGVAGAGTVSVIQTSNNTVVDTIGGFTGPVSIAITPNGEYAYVANYGNPSANILSSKVSVITLATNTVTATVTVGLSPSGIAINQNSTLVYVIAANTSQNAGTIVAGQGIIYIIDVANNEVQSTTIAVGQDPQAIIISPDGFFAYVTNSTSNSLDIISLPTSVITGQGCKMRNVFLMQEDFINKLTWQATGISLPVVYYIYRDQALLDLAAMVPATTVPLQYLDHDTNPNTTYTYYIIGIDVAGTRTEPTSITVTACC